MPRMRVCFCRGEELKFLSHLELVRTFIRALRRAGLPMLYSKGFNPQPRLVFASPLPVGITAEAEYADFFLRFTVDGEVFCNLLNGKLPDGLFILEAQLVDEAEPSLMNVMGAALYCVVFSNQHLKVIAAEMGRSTGDVLEEAISRLLLLPTLVVKRRVSKGVKEVDIRPFILNIFMAEDKQKRDSVLYLLLRTGNRGGARPDEVLTILYRKGGLFSLNIDQPAIHRVQLFARVKDKLVPLGFRGSGKEVNYEKNSCQL